jgi:signal transduction histidine kinase/CheY-like chemotaxis protein
MRFQTRLTVTLLLAWTTCLVAMYVVIGLLLIQRERSHLANAASQQAIQTAEAVSSHLFERRGDLGLLAQALSQSSQDRATITQRLNTIRDAYGAYEWLRWIGNDGRVLADTNQLLIGQVEPAFKQLRDDGVTILSRQALDGQGMFVLMAVHGSGGWIMGAVPLQRLHRQVADPTRWPIDTTIEIIDEGGVLQFCSAGIDGIGLPHAQAARIRAIGDQKIVFNRTTTMITAPIPGLGTLVGTVPERAWKAPVQQIQNVILLTGGIGLIFGALLIAWITRSVARPLHRLTNQAQDMGQGRGLIDQRKDPGEPVEVTQLRDILITQDERLSERIRDLDAAGERMRLAETVAQLGVWEYNPATQRLEWDAGMFALYAAKPEKFSGQIEEWSRRIHPEDLAATEELLRLSLASGTRFVAMFRILRDDGTMLWIESLAKQLPQTATSEMRLIGVNRDITARISTEMALAANQELLQRTGRLASIGGWQLDPSAQMITWSDEAYRIHHLPIGEPISWERALGFFPTEACGQVRTAVQASLSQGTSFDLEVPLVTADKRSIWVRFIGQAEHRNGVCLRLTGAIQDITAQREIAERLRAATTAAEAAAKAKGEFLATMSHEIRTPMNGVIGIAEMLIDTTLDAHQRQLVNTIHDSGHTLMAIINDILDFSKFEAGNVELEQLPYDPAATAQKILALLKAQAEAKGLRLSFDSGTPIVLVGDAGRFGQVLLNLIGNAIKFTHAGGVTVRVASSAGMARIEIVDTGIGIDPAKRDKLFQRFTQLDASTTRKYGGTGLGLAICKLLVEAMGGRIEVDSVAEQGSTFRILLPLPATPVSLPVVSKVTPPPTIAQRRMRVLVVEDNPVNQVLARIMLSKFGHSVEVAGSGREGVVAWESGAYDLVLMDMQMPGMNGLEATVVIRGLEASRSLPRTPIIALTANAMKEDQDACLASGMDSILTKPLTLAALTAALATISPSPSIA